MHFQEFPFELIFGVVISERRESLNPDVFIRHPFMSMKLFRRFCRNIYRFIPTLMKSVGHGQSAVYLHPELAKAPRKVSPSRPGEFGFIGPFPFKSPFGAQPFQFPS